MSGELSYPRGNKEWKKRGHWWEKKRGSNGEKEITYASSKKSSKEKQISGRKKGKVEEGKPLESHDHGSIPGGGSSITKDLGQGLRGKRGGGQPREGEGPQHGKRRECPGKSEDSEKKQIKRDD